MPDKNQILKDPKPVQKLNGFEWQKVKPKKNFFFQKFSNYFTLVQSCMKTRGGCEIQD